MKNLKQTFDETLNKFEKKDPGAIMAALTYVNMEYLKELQNYIGGNIEDIDDFEDFEVPTTIQLDDEFVRNIMEFGEYFLTNYGQETVEYRTAMFNDEEPLILDIYISAGLEILDQHVLEMANQGMTKKIQFDINKLKTELDKLSDEYENIYLEKQGYCLINNNACEVSGYYEYEKGDDSEELNDFLKTFLFSDGCVLFIECDNDTDTGVLYGVMVENHSWKSIDIETMRDIIGELDDEDLEELGYENLIVDELKKNF